MAVELASGYVSISPSTKGFGSDLERQIGPDVTKASRKVGQQAGENFSSSFGSGLAKLATIAAGAFATIKVGSFFKDAIDQASDLNETVSKVGVVLGADVLPQVEAFAEGAATSLGQSKQAALDAAATFGVFGKSAGLAGKPLADFSTDLVQLAGDMASFSNTTPEDAIEAISAALRGESEPIRRYGVLLDDATLKNRALQLGIISTTKNALTPQQRVLAAQAELMAQTADAQGDFARTSGGLANQQRILTAQLANARAELGRLFLPVALKVVTFLNTRAIPAFRDVASSVKATLTPAIQAFKAEFDGVGKPVEGFAAKLGDLVGRIINTIKLIPAAFKTAFQTGDVTGDGIIGVVEQIGIAASKLVTFFTVTAPAAVKTFMDAFNGAQPDEQSGILGLAGKVGEAFGGINDLIKENPNLKEVVKDLGFLAAALVALNQIPGGSKVLGAVASNLLSIGPALASNPFGAALLGLGALAGAFVLADKKIGPFSDSVDEVQKAFADDGFGAALREAANQFDKLWDLVRPKLVRFVAQAEQWFKDHVADLFNFQVFDPRQLEAGVAPPDIMQQLEIPPGAAPPPPPPKTFKSFGEGFADAMLNQVVPAIGNWFTTNRQMVFDAIDKILTVITEWVDTTGIPFMKEQGPKLSLALIQGFGEFQLQNILSEALGLGSIAAALGQLPELMFDKFDEVFAPGGKLDQLVLGFLGGLNQSILDGLDGIGRFVVGSLDAIGRFTVEAGAEIATAIGGLLLQLLSLPEAFFDAADGIFDGMWDGIYTAFKAALNFVIRAWNSLEFTLPTIDTHIPGIGKIGGFSVSVAKIDELAKGGVFTNTTTGLFRLAETPAARPEIVTPQRLMAETFRKELATVGAGAPLANTLVINEASNARQTAQQVDALYRWKLTGRGDR